MSEKKVWSAKISEDVYNNWIACIEYIKPLVASVLKIDINKLSMEDIIKFICDNLKYEINTMRNNKYGWGIETMTLNEMKNNPNIIFVEKNDPKWMEKPEHGDFVLLE